jgi:hypothetical protein
MSLDAATAMRVGLRQQLEELASERERVLVYLASIDARIAQTRERLDRVKP